MIERAMWEWVVQPSRPFSKFGVNFWNNGDGRVSGLIFTATSTLRRLVESLDGTGSDHWDIVLNQLSIDLRWICEEWGVGGRIKGNDHT